MSSMHKIMITGNAGSGKTTLSYKLAKILKRQDVFSLDKIVWQPGWIPTSKTKRESEIQKIIEKPSWIVDGVSKTILEAADAIIFLDYPRHICYWRALKRNYKYLFKSRDELPLNCPEILIIPQLIKIIWAFPSKVKPAILNHIKLTKTQQIVHVKNNKELHSLLLSLSEGK